MKKPALLVVAALLFHAHTARTEDPDPAPIAEANNSFAVDLYQQLKAEPGNLFFSSYSVSSALAMTYAGAGGDTAAQMQKVLHLPGGDAAHAGYAALNGSLAAAQSGNVEMNVANALWPQAKLALLDPFLKTTGTHYGATLTPVDFSNAPAAAAVINRWVDEQTRGKIKDIIPPSAITPLTRLILTNAIYFKGDWAKAFDEKRTRDLPFHAAGGTTTPIAMMSQKDSFAYAATDGLQILEMPYLSGGASAGSDAAKRIAELEASIKEFEGSLRGYDGKMPPEKYREIAARLRAARDELNALKKENGDGTDRLAMVILLPGAKDGLPALEDKLTAENLAAWIASTRKQKVQVTIPKWKLETKFSLSNVLKSLGMPDAFSKAADFSKMTAAGDLYIADVLHKAFVEVNEKGTEAAAATGVIMATKSAAVRPDPTFTADHPFLFLIRDQKTGAVLFMGRLADPKI